MINRVKSLDRSTLINDTQNLTQVNSGEYKMILAYNVYYKKFEKIVNKHRTIHMKTT